jgi:transcriptional regulator GlxA family with amidase domain
LQTTGIYEKDVIRLNDAKMFEMLMRDCFITMKNRHPGFRKRASAIAYQLLLELGNCIMLESQPELLVRAVEIMENHLSQRLSLSRLAELLNSSHSSLNRIFKATYKQTPIDHFIQMKMDMAKSMLINTNLQIQEIAERVGYDNALYFSTEFRKKIGVSPRKFRKNIPSNQKN